MARYKGPSCRLCRREGQRLFLKGSRCTSPKCALERKAYAPGQHGNSRMRRPKESEYGNQLREKQKVRRIYGVLEKQFRICFKEAERMSGITGDNLLMLLETRLDNAVYRMGLAVSRAESRQLVSHRHVTVNGRIVNVASYRVRPDDVIAVKPRSQRIQPVQMAVNLASGRPVPGWLSVNLGTLSGTVLSRPTRAQVNADVRENMVVEFYSR